MFKNFQAIIVLGTFSMFGVLGGCSYQPAGSDGGDRGGSDAGPAQIEACTARVSACRHRCNMLDLGVGCKLCCLRNGTLCDMGAESYSFEACLDVSDKE
jgi:hypothetical protein